MLFNYDGNTWIVTSASKTQSRASVARKIGGKWQSKNGKKDIFDNKTISKNSLSSTQ